MWHGFIFSYKEREAEERAAEHEREMARLRIIEEERQKLLKDHAAKLLGYLPKVRKRICRICSLMFESVACGAVSLLRQELFCT